MKFSQNITGKNVPKKLEDQLDEKEKVEDNLRAEILKLTTELATLRERVLNLEKENERLKTR